MGTLFLLIGFIIVVLFVSFLLREAIALPSLLMLKKKYGNEAGREELGLESEEPMLSEPIARGIMNGVDAIKDYREEKLMQKEIDKAMRRIEAERIARQDFRL